MNNYYIKSNYKAREAAETKEVSCGDFWNNRRIKDSSRFQFHVYKYAASLFKKAGLKTLLDVGGGYPNKLWLFNDAEITICDQSTIAPLITRKFPGYEFLSVDLENPDILENRKFDMVLCIDVLEHLLNPDPCLEFLKRAAGNMLIISTPERDVLRGKDCLVSPKPQHVREWNSAEFLNYIKSHGFLVKEQRFVSQSKLSCIEFFIAKTAGFKCKR